MLEFNQLVSVNFQGLVVTFGRSTTGVSTDIYYNVLGLDVDVNNDSLNWSGFAKVDIVKQVRQVGMSIISVQADNSTLQPTDLPFRVVTDQKYISIVQQSSKGTLYVNRFRLLETKSGSDQKTTAYTLSPAWEVRYARSHKEDVPADKSDSQEYLDPDGQPFLEPSIELSMIDVIAAGAFEVLILPISGSSQFAWQFFALDAATSSVRMYNFPASDNGLFNVTGKNVGANYKIAPDSVFSVASSATGNALPIQSAPRASTYTKHEKVVQPDGTSIGVKRASRAMIAIPIKVGADLATVTIDSAVSTAGTLATLSGLIVASNIVPAPADLVFDGVAYLTLTGASVNPLSIKGRYKMSFMIAPAALGDDVLIIGGDVNASAQTQAPYIKIVDSDKLELGFGDGTAAVQCRTLHQVLISGVWASVSVAYSGVGDNPFALSINGSSVPLTPCASAAEPSGSAVSRVAGGKVGFKGALNSIIIQVADAPVMNLPCNTVNYSVSPPTTPNNAASGVTALVYGAKLEPSSSPINVDMSGAFYIDAKGLTFYAGIAGFIRPASSTCLIDGSDGLLHLYFAATDAQFSVAQFSTTSARASFYVDWSTDLGSGKGVGLQALSEEVAVAGFHRGWATDEWTHIAPRLLLAPNGTQSGFLNFVANRVGTYMNTTEITVTSSQVSSLLCDIVVKAPSGVGTERWSGLPRDINQLSVIWNGAGCDNPDDQGVLNQSTPYYDYMGVTPTVLVPNTLSTNGSYFLFTSVPFLALNLASATVAAGGVDQVLITLETSAPSNWAATDLIVQQWPSVPANANLIHDVFVNKAVGYNYSAVTTPGTRAYGLTAVTTRSDDQVSYVSLFVKDALTSFSVSIENGSTAVLCKVTVCAVVLSDVSRDQNTFAQTLNGKNTAFTYPAGYIDSIASKIFALTDGLTAAINNSTGPVAAVGAMAYAALFRFLYIGPTYKQGQISQQAKAAASIMQHATLEFQGTTQSITRSTLFGAVVVSPPTDGGTGLIANTAIFTGGKAPVLELGINGGWMAPPPRFCIGLNANSGNYVSFDVSKTFTPSNQLAILSDLTLQAWVNQDFSKNNQNSRVLNYKVPGNIAHPDMPIQYLTGTMRGSGMCTAANTFVQGSFNFLPPNLTVQIYIKVADSVSGTIFTVSEVRGSNEFVSLGLNQTRKLDVTFQGKSVGLSSSSPLPTNTWTCVTVVVSDAGAGKVNLAIYVNGGEPVKAVATNTFTGSLGALTVGSTLNKGLKMSANGAAFWQRALSVKEVQSSFNFGFPDNDSMLGIRWNFAEGEGTVVMNSAATGPDYNSTVINPPTPPWDANGAFFVPYMGRNDYVLVSNRILKGWTQVSLSSQQGRSIKLDGNHFGKVADGESFNPSASFALEAWVKPNAVNSKQIIVEKPGSYSFYINTLGQVCLDVHTKQDGNIQDAPPVLGKYSVNASIAANTTSYVAVNFTSGANASDAGSKEYVHQTYFLTITLYVNGVLVKTYTKNDFVKSIAVDNAKSSFYLGQAADTTFRYIGLISHVRAWSRTISSAEIASVYALHLDPINRDGLIAGWNFDELSGTVAADLNQNVAMQLDSNQLWSIWQDVAQGAIFVNGQSSIGRRKTATDVGGYGSADAQFTMGGMMQGTSLTLPYSGQLEDVRLFSVRLTGQQIRESMNKPLYGNEEYLAAYWSIDAGSGQVIYDMRGTGNNGSMLPTASPPSWKASSAPIKNEGQSVHNVLDADQDNFTATIVGEPSVIEYGSAEKDAYGNVYSVRKRGYFYMALTGQTVLQVGYKVGDLDTIYVGQVQSKPSVVGYIEGGPPIPSENQTLAYWSGDMGGPAKLYETVSSVTYIESETKTWSFKGNQSALFTGAFNIKGGFYQKSKSEVSVGLGAEATTQVLETKVKIGAKNMESGDIGSISAVVQTHANTTSLSNSMTPAGYWEPANAILNPTVGRRYIQNNVGSAVVKSATADLFMMALKGSQTPVGYMLVPNKTIPIDTNIINFPINPKYVKNGTLDGKVGLVNDPDYPGANAERGSYFKPVEAYALKRKIEKEEQQIAAYYNQFDTDKYRTINSLDSVKAKLKENPAYNFAEGLNQRSLFNNYVWTAVGGLHKEEHSVANSYSEEYTGTSSFKFALGAEINADVGTPFGGYYVEADVMLGGAWTMTATKGSMSSNAFSLACVVTPTGFLPAPIMSTDAQGKLKFDGYTNAPAAGKVDGYRYMAFLLAPSKENFTALNGVMDQNWLQNSTSAAAAAMRTASAADNGTWRILYRTTYVSRVPAAFQPVKDDTNAPNITPPANLPSNDWLITVISRQNSAPNPTPLEIGSAIDAVLGSKANPGILKDLIPWWTVFYASAQVYGSTEFIELAELRVDLLNYMLSMYESKKYLST